MDGNSEASGVSTASLSVTEGDLLEMLDWVQSV